MNYRIKAVEAVRYPVLKVTFDDGFSGEYDLTDVIARGPIFAPLKNRAYFKTVTVGEYGHTFGWNLQDEGHEIDFCPDATRIKLETKAVRARAAEYLCARRTMSEHS